MPAKVWIPPLLREPPGTEEVVYADGDSLYEALAKLGTPGDRVIESAREHPLHTPQFAIFVEGERVTDLAYPLVGDCDISIIPEIRGGR